MSSSLAPQAPAVEEATLHDRLAHAGAAEDHRLGQQQARIGGEIHLDGPPQPCLIEQDRFLWQPRQLAAGRDV